MSRQPSPFPPDIREMLEAAPYITPKEFWEFKKFVQEELAKSKTKEEMRNRYWMIILALVAIIFALLGILVTLLVTK